MEKGKEGRKQGTFLVLTRGKPKNNLVKSEWDELSRERVDSQSQEVFKERLGMALTAMVWLTRW